MRNSEGHDLWHRRLGHLGHKNMQRVRQLTEGVNFEDVKFKPCVPCVEGKLSRKPFPPRQKFERAPDKLGLVHTDLCGPITPPGLKNKLYMLLFIDDFSRKTFDF